MSGALTLKEARETGQLERFIREREAEGLAPADEAEFNDAVRLLATPRQSERRTARSQGRGGSTGTRTRQGKPAST